MTVKEMLDTKYLEMLKTLNKTSWETEVDTLCGDVDILFQQEKIKWQEHELLFRLIQRLYPFDGEMYKMKGVGE